MDPKERSKQEYSARINMVMDYIERNIGEKISLDKLSQIACFSPFHFHRIFTAITGETLNSFIQRIRIEKAAIQLRNEQRASISEIANNCGFASAAHFSRIFRKYMGMTAKEYRESDKVLFAKEGVYYSKNGQVVRKINQHEVFPSMQFCSDNTNNFNHSELIIMETKIEIREMPEMNVIYCRHKGRFDQIGKAYEKLMKWAGPRGLLNFPQTKTLTVYHDDPSVTAIEQVRQSACITVEGEVKVEGEIGRMKVDGGRYAVGHFEIDEAGFEKAWNTMCLWFTESGYQPGDGNPYELYYSSPEDDAKRKFVLDICIPVKQL